MIKYQMLFLIHWKCFFKDNIVLKNKAAICRQKDDSNKIRMKNTHATSASTLLLLFCCFRFCSGTVEGQLSSTWIKVGIARKVEVNWKLVFPKWDHFISGPASVWPPYTEYCHLLSKHWAIAVKMWKWQTFILIDIMVKETYWESHKCKHWCKPGEVINKKRNYKERGWLQTKFYGKE